MMPSRRRRLMAAFALTALLTAGCATEDTDDPDAAEGSESTSETSTPQESDSSEPESGELTFSTPSSALGFDNENTPVWAFPANVEGWEVTTFDQEGVNQLSKDEGASLFTSYQLRMDQAPAAEDDASLDYLTTFASQIAASEEVEEVTEPTYSIMTIDSPNGEIEFIAQELEYTVAEGETYRSRYLSRVLGNVTMAVQYAAPSDI